MKTVSKMKKSGCDTFGLKLAGYKGEAGVSLYFAMVVVWWAAE